MEVCTKNILYQFIVGQTSTNGNEVYSIKSTLRVQTILKRKFINQCMEIFELTR